MKSTLLFGDTTAFRMAYLMSDEVESAKKWTLPHASSLP